MAARTVKVNLGCGQNLFRDWINVDNSLGARLFKVPGFRHFNRLTRVFAIEWSDEILLHDLTKPLPWKTEEVDMIYTSHTLEHLSKSDGLCFLRECFRVLRRRGVLRVIVPDFQVIIDRYIAGVVHAEDFVQLLGCELSGSKGLRGKFERISAFPHQCMYTYDRLVSIMESIGFSAESRRPFDSAIPEIRDIELFERTIDAVIVEGTKE